MKLICPKHLGKEAKRYFKKYGKPLQDAQKLTFYNMPKFIQWCIACGYVERLTVEIEGCNVSLLQENTFVDGSGQECKNYSESSPSKALRYYIAVSARLSKELGFDTMQVPVEESDGIGGMLD